MFCRNLSSGQVKKEFPSNYIRRILEALKLKKKGNSVGRSQNRSQDHKETVVMSTIKSRTN